MGTVRMRQSVLVGENFIVEISPVPVSRCSCTRARIYSGTVQTEYVEYEAGVCSLRASCDTYDNDPVWILR